MKFVTQGREWNDPRHQSPLVTNALLALPQAPGAMSVHVCVRGPGGAGGAPTMPVKSHRSGPQASKR